MTPAMKAIIKSTSNLNDSQCAINDSHLSRDYEFRDVPHDQIERAPPGSVKVRTVNSVHHVGFTTYVPQGANQILTATSEALNHGRSTAATTVLPSPLVR